MSKVNTIGKDFSLGGLAKFVAAPVLTNLLVSILQTLDDSLFLSRYCGPQALAAFSMAMPYFFIIDAFGMLISCVSRNCSIKMGEHKNEEAMSDFTTACFMALAIGCCFTVFLSLFMDPLLDFLGETELLKPYAKAYMSISRFNTPLFLLMYIQNRFFVIAGKPKYAMISSLINGVCNIAFDFLFIVVLQIGIKGCAYTNLISTFLTCVFAFIFFINQNREMHYVKPNSNPIKLFARIFDLGRASFITSLSLSLSSYITNSVIIKLGGETFVSAYTIVNNVQFMMMNIFFSLLGNTLPMISYRYGEKNAQRLVKMMKQVLTLVFITVCFVTLVIALGREFFVGLYLNKNSSVELKQLVRYGFKVAPLAYIFFGFNVSVSEFAGACDNSKVSTIISVVENVVFANLFMLTLPRLFGAKLVWYNFVICEVCTCLCSLYFVNKYKDVYGYGKNGVATFSEEKKQ